MPTSFYYFGVRLRKWNGFLVRYNQNNILIHIAERRKTRSAFFRGRRVNIRMDTKAFRTRQEFHHEEHPGGKEFIIALDAGYSSIKAYYENGFFAFPSYARKIDNSMLQLFNKKDILYRDLETKEMYILGYSAQDMISSTETNDTYSESYARKRYGAKTFKILCNTALGIALERKNDDREIFIQTGLPSSYEEADKPDLIKALSKPSHFEIKVGERPWKEFDLAIKPENIDVMPQPAGSLYSVLINNKGAYMPGARDILFGNCLVMDIGFGTFDFYGIKGRAIACKESTDEMGMRRVLQSTCKKMMSNYSEDVRINALQRNLSTGFFTHLNEDEMKTEDVPLSPLLEEANQEIFEEAMEKARGITSSFRDYKYLIITGGTGAAWIDKIREYLKGMHTLQIIPGNVNDNNSMIYSNVRGYYLYRYAANKKK